MYFTDYYKGEKLTPAQSRYDITAFKGDYNLFENILINKRGFNIGGLSFNCVNRPDRWRNTKASLAITKGTKNITSIKQPGININAGYGDIKGTQDACIIIFNSDFQEVGISTIEIFIARGLKRYSKRLWEMLLNGELKAEIKIYRQIAKRKKLLLK